MEKLKGFLSKNNIEFYLNFDISQISSIRLGGIATIAIFPKTERELKILLIFLSSQKFPYRVVGNLSNLLFTKNIDYPIIITNKMCDDILIDKNVVQVSAGILLTKFCDTLRKNGLSGLEGLIGIPATVGGAIMSNAGAYGYSISDRLVSITAFYGGKIIEIKKNEIKFSYHRSNLKGFIILSAKFLLENKSEYDIMKLCNEFTYLRTKSQPTGLSLGSVFEKISGKSAGFYIERSGLKNNRVGGIIISHKHANFFINDKNGSALDFLRLMTQTICSVEKQFGLTLTPEIEQVGDKDETFSRPSHSFK